MVCKGLETLTDNTIIGILQFPTSCDYQFYAKIMGAFFVVLSLILFNKDKEKFVKADMISCLGVSAIATISVAVIGTFIKIIQLDILIEIVVVGMVFIVLWLLKR